MISTENKYLLKLLADALHNKKISDLGEINWNIVYEEMKKQAVYPFAEVAVNELDLDENEQEAIIHDIAGHFKHVYTLLEEQDQILQLLMGNGIKCAVLKGSAAASSYLHPEYRCMGDIDLIVNPVDFDKSCQLMIENGYMLQNEMFRNERHDTFYKDGISFEIHHRFSSSDDTTANDILDRYIYSGLENLEFDEQDGYRFPVLPPLENGLVLLSHINQHLSRGLGLRQIIDWMCYAEKHLDNPFWCEKFCNASIKIGMKRLAECTTAMCKKYLGLGSSITWCDEILTDDPDIVDDYMEYIFEHGNFGRKDSTEIKQVAALRLFRNPVNALKKLQKRGLKYNPGIRDRKILSHFAWIYQFIKWLRTGR